MEAEKTKLEAQFANFNVSLALVEKAMIAVGQQAKDDLLALNQTQVAANKWEAKKQKIEKEIKELNIA